MSKKSKQKITVIRQMLRNLPHSLVPFIPVGYFGNPLQKAAGG